MRDISARELKGHNILAVERFQDSTRWMIEFAVRKPRSPYGSPGDEVRLFLTEDGYRQALDAQRGQQIKIKRYAHVVEGHNKRRRGYIWLCILPVHRFRKWFYHSGQLRISCVHVLLG